MRASRQGPAPILLVATGAVLLCIGSYWGLVLSLVLTFLVALRARLEERALEQGLEGYRNYAANVRYLSGFTGSNGLALMLVDRAILFTDPRYKIQAASEVDCSVQVVRDHIVAKDLARNLAFLQLNDRFP